jgi:hypothetical protein
MAKRHPDQHHAGGVPDGLILGILGFLLGITVLVWTATGIAGLLAHGDWPSDVHFTRTPMAMRHLIGQPHDIPGAWPDAPPGALPRAGLFWGIFIGQLMILFVLTVFGIGVFARYRLVRAARRTRQADGDPRLPGTTPQPTGRSAADTHLWAESTGAGGDAARQTEEPSRDAPGSGGTRPGTRLDTRQGTPMPDGAAPAPAWAESPVPVPVPESAAQPGGTTTGAGAPAAATERELTRTYIAFAAHRSDKGKRLVQPAVLSAAGAVVVTTADPDTFHQTVGNRAKLGPVHVYDPVHLVDTPGRLRWAPHSGCEDPRTATVRARALLGPLRPRAGADIAMYDAANTLLRCWLHAAATDGLPFRQVHRWAGGNGAQDAVRILRTHTAASSGWSGELESVLHAHPDRRDTAQALVHRALESLNSVHIRDACNPSRSATLDVESFVRERGTLYVVGEPNEDPRTRPGATPLLTALVSSVVEHGRSMAARSPAGRLDPPLTFVLDDVAALAPLPGLPDLLATGTALGLPTLAVLRSPEQSRDQWPGAPWQRADVRLVLGPSAPALHAEIPDAIHLG